MLTHAQDTTPFEEAREAMSHKSFERGHERGFALILAILALMLLTFLGLTLATSTSTELRIATNYRWNQQALYNAEAGVEAGKRILQNLNWTRILPRANRGTWNPAALTLPVAAPATTSYPLANVQGTRNWEMGNCDKLGNGVGFGAILHDEAGTPSNASIAARSSTVGSASIRRMSISGNPRRAFGCRRVQPAPRTP